MEVLIYLETDLLRKVIEKLDDSEILFKVTDDGVVLQEFNGTRAFHISCSVRRPYALIHLPERLFPKLELYRWADKGDKIRIVFERDHNCNTFRSYYVETLEEMKA